ncbi:MAG TPA: alpha/beta fold hydrolase [Trebonia sp.]|jgi:pimeloyl-ACP methyl ester carboxylesterase|nr:alpha/beta fold hydrolase [Trebonia sp.]
MTTRETPVLLLHGFWHGAWCWSEVLGRLTAAGTRALAVDMAGHGLRARRPAAPTARPFDPAALAAEPSPAIADLDEAAALFVAQARALGGGAPVTAVAHSMGGNVLTRAVQDAPGLFAHAVYVTAFMPASGVPAAAYIFAPENEGDLVQVAMVADPAAIGGLRLDAASPDPSYRQLVRDAFFGDVGADLADAAIALLTPDAPAGIAGGATTLTADGWGSVPRTYVVCTRDRALQPAMQRRFIELADAAFPGNPTTVHTLESSHSPFLSMPGELADIILKL